MQFAAAYHARIGISGSRSLLVVKTTFGGPAPAATDSLDL